MRKAGISMKKKMLAIMLCIALVLANVMTVFAQEADENAEDPAVESEIEETESDVDISSETDQIMAEETEDSEQSEKQDVAAKAPLKAVRAGEEAQTAGAEEELIAALEAGGEYTLKEDITLTQTLKVQKKVVLDLSGHTITKNDTADAVEVNTGGDLTVKNGTISTDSNYLFNVYDNGKLTIEDGTYVTGKYMFYTRGSAADKKAVLTVNGGTFSNKKATYIGYLSSYSEAYIYGGELKSASGFALMNQTKATVETSAKAPSGYGYENQKYMLTDAEYDVPVKMVWGKEGSKNGPELKVSGAGIYGNFWNSETDITINSGVIQSTGATAIYQPQQGKITMNGGCLQGESAIDAKMGEFIFNGGYVIGTGTADDESFESALGGTTADGSAIVFQTEYYGANDSDPGSRGPANQQAAAGGSTHLPRNNDLTLTINGGVFISKNNAPITVKDWNMCKQKTTYTITGGRFSSFPKTVEMKHGENDGATAYCGVPICNTVDSVYNYLSNGEYKFAPAAYYDGVDLQYGYKASEAAYYASMEDAVADRNYDKDARAYIYYLLNNGLPEGGKIDRQLQVFYNLKDYCGRLIPENVGMGTDKAVFGYSFHPDKVSYNPKQYVLTDQADGYALWAPAVTYDANGGTFQNGEKAIPVLATTASGLFEGDGYGYVVDENKDKTYVTLDEGGEMIVTPDGTVLLNPADPVNGSKKFLGWYYKDGTPFDASKTQIKENMTVYAKWEEEKPESRDPADAQKPTDISKSDGTVKSGSDKAAKTGDMNHIFGFTGVLAAAFGVMVLGIKRRKYRE